MPLSSGDKLGPYENLFPIGTGDVYRARDMRLHHTVAINVLPEQIAGRDDLRQRFICERVGGQRPDRPMVPIQNWAAGLGK